MSLCELVCSLPDFCHYVVMRMRKTKGQALARFRASQYQPKSKGNAVLSFLLSTLKNR